MAAHILDFLLETALLGFRILIASGLGLVVVKLRIRIIDHEITGMANLQAEIHIIEGYRQFFLKASYFLKDFFFLLEDPEEVFFTETGRPLWDGLGDFLPVLPFFPLLFIYTVVWSLFCDVDVMWM